jgi:acetylornithine/N-succinyldiaminopimelate aminotransferase
MVEPIQGEGGIHVATPEYLQTIRDLCDEHGALMILDEVQTGMGRTGRWFGYQHYEITPDIITLAKSLGGGVAIGAMMAKANIAASLVPGTHASTFGGNSIACAAAIAVIEAIEEDYLLDNTVKMGQYSCEQLEKLKDKYPIIDHIRGKGLMIGIQLTMPGANIVNQCLEKNLRINCTQESVLRFMPSMTVTSDQIDKAIGIMDEVLAGGESS